MLCQLIAWVLLTSLQPGRLQEETDFGAVFQNIDRNIVNLNTLIRSHVKRSEQFRARMDDSISSLRADLSSLNDSVSNLSMSLQEHKQQTANELAQLQTSLDTTQSSLTQQVNARLNTLATSLSQHQQQSTSSLETANSQLETLRETTAQLSTDQQQIQTSISDVECADTKESLQLYNNLTHQLDSIQRNVAKLVGPYTCGDTGGWRRVFYMDMTDPSTTCPSGWNLTEYSKRTCGRASDGFGTCDSVTFPVSGREYDRVCGRIKAYQWGSNFAFYPHVAETIDEAYVTGLSLTHGDPREHIWTFAAGLSETHSVDGPVCPCDSKNFTYWNSRVPSFVGSDYFCESGLNRTWRYEYNIYPDDPLWDGESCPTGTCCSFNSPPFFSKTLDSLTSDNLELRLCDFYSSTYSDVPVELIELYVQ